MYNKCTGLPVLSFANAKVSVLEGKKTKTSNSKLDGTSQLVKNRKTGQI